MLELVTVVKDDFLGLMETYKSLLSQSDHEFSWLVIDGSREPISMEKYFKEAFFEVRVLHQPPKGIYHAMNAGMAQAKQDWVWFVNAGDVLFDSQTIENVRKTISKNPELVAFGFSVGHVDPSGNLWHTSTPRLRYLVESKYTVAEINHQGFIVSLSVMKSTGGFDANLRYAADGKFMDLIANSQLILLSDICVLKFILGGASSQNISKTLGEIDSYRPYSETRASHTCRRILLIIKTKFRLKIIRKQGFVLRIFFYLRNFIY